MHGLVVGTGRCGTTWASEVLQASGIRTAHQSLRHEHVFGADWDANSVDIEVSFEAAPLAAMYARSGVDVLLLVRNPWAVVHSWLSLGVFWDTDDKDFAALYESIRWHCPAVLDGQTPIERAAAFWVQWNCLALRSTNLTVLPIEVTTAEMVCTWAGAAQPARELPRSNQRDEEKIDVSLSHYDVYSVPGVARLASALGYI